ncbi:metallophosphoesterase [Aurantimonas sp. 22II-16-19i]|uniref:metallophosphoesterase n=1 Tax=Aurantimonas sp. 22II-16-19i TaxID=1317114 RepID=UPI0009F7D880|nr:metallophosphoesterase [Aurantimonas sp. 22II-16-19i]ORE94027.1 metallophosphoesterase [Aurantimonas sp. 22II-16-19i]
MSSQSHPNAIVAIGDVHGESGLFRRFLDGVDRLAEERGVQPAIYILGDLVDRGEDSCGAMEIAERVLSERPGSKLLLGNHDEWLLRFLENALSLEEIFHWLDQGGAETLASYGFRLADTPPAEIRRAINARWPGHLRMLAEASPIEFAGGFAFVHAGVDPDRPLDRQDPHDCVWIRAPFMNHVGRLSHLVLHGHTPQKSGVPTVTENRLSLDTGAVFTGHLAGAWVDVGTGTIACLRASLDEDLHRVAPHRLDRGLGTAMDAAPCP